MKTYRRKYLSMVLLSLAFLLAVAPRLYADDAWLPEFEDICSKTQDAEALGKDELKKLIARCDVLKPVIERSDNAQKSVYLFRLDKCRKLFKYVVDTSDK